MPTLGCKAKGYDMLLVNEQLDALVKWNRKTINRAMCV